MISQAELISKGYHSLVPGRLISIFDLAMSIAKSIVWPRCKGFNHSFLHSTISQKHQLLRKLSFVIPIFGKNHQIVTFGKSL